MTSLFPIALGVFCAMVLLIGAYCARRASRGFDPPRRADARAERYADPAPMPGEISASQQQAARWQHCDWCDPAGTATTSAACICDEPCERPSGLWCAAGKPEASAEETEREIAAMFAALDEDLS